MYVFLSKPPQKLVVMGPVSKPRMCLSNEPFEFAVQLLGRMLVNEVV